MSASIYRSLINPDQPAIWDLLNVLGGKEYDVWVKIAAAICRSEDRFLLTDEFILHYSKELGSIDRLFQILDLLTKGGLLEDAGFFCLVPSQKLLDKCTEQQTTSQEND